VYAFALRWSELAVKRIARNPGGQGRRPLNGYERSFDLAVGVMYGTVSRHRSAPLITEFGLTLGADSRRVDAARDG